MLFFINEVILVCHLMTNVGVPFWYFVTFYHSLPFVETVCEILSKFVICYHILLDVVIFCHFLSLFVTVCHILYKVTKAFKVTKITKVYKWSKVTNVIKWYVLFAYNLIYNVVVCLPII